MLGRDFRDILEQALRYGASMIISDQAAQELPTGDEYLRCCHNRKQEVRVTMTSATRVGRRRGRAAWATRRRRYILQRLGGHAEAAEAAARLSREESTLRKREQQSSIFGAMTLKGKKEAQDRLTRVGRPPRLSGKVEKELRGECNANPYQRARALTQIAVTRPSQADRALFLQQAQAELIKRARPEGKRARSGLSRRRDQFSRGVPGPLILTRTKRKELRRKGLAGRKAGRARGIWEGRGERSGGLAAQHRLPPGQAGTCAPLSDVITVSGLTPNERYIFALAFYDATGALTDTVGPSNPPVTPAKTTVSSVPDTDAHRVGCPKDALSAARPVVAHSVEKVAVDEDGVERLFGDQLTATETRDSGGAPHAAQKLRPGPFYGVQSRAQAAARAKPRPNPALAPSIASRAPQSSAPPADRGAGRGAVYMRPFSVQSGDPVLQPGGPAPCEPTRKMPGDTAPARRLPRVLATINQTAGLTSGAVKVAAGLRSQLFERLAVTAEVEAVKAVGIMDLGVFTLHRKSVSKESENAPRSGSSAAAIGSKEGGKKRLGRR
ncbi:hypothetical protein KFL_001160140 [Klebsormidium nitens]|uniref:Uncharacterized protein n=1 Tax=Klebsormidium nitens TaxID=105231 RepID=A0A1Y1I088_KLENI|nr:hypothetical protein KFL_001160140 [Klebsormidium nitens]|eukprot:GAQ82581.1 hypothetical protein KFL_001160140 [Klebsormidium nitens]